MEAGYSNTTSNAELVWGSKLGNADLITVSVGKPKAATKPNSTFGTTHKKLPANFRALKVPIKRIEFGQVLRKNDIHDADTIRTRFCALGPTFEIP